MHFYLLKLSVPSEFTYKCKPIPVKIPMHILQPDEIAPKNII